MEKYHVRLFSVELVGPELKDTNEVTHVEFTLEGSGRDVKRLARKIASGYSGALGTEAGAEVTELGAYLGNLDRSGAAMAARYGQG